MSAASEPVSNLPHGTEELRDDIHRVIGNYPKLTFVECVGILHLVVMDLAEALKDCEHPQAQKER